VPHNGHSDLKDSTEVGLRSLLVKTDLGLLRREKVGCL